MKMLQKIIDGKSLKISQEHFYDWVSFNKVIYLKMYRTLAVLKNHILRKPYFEKSMVDQIPNKVATL